MWHPVCDVFSENSTNVGLNMEPVTYTLAYKTGLAFTPTGPDLAKCVIGKEKIEAFTININPDLVPSISVHDLLDSFTSTSECHMFEEDGERYYMNFHVKTELEIAGHGKFNGYCLSGCMLRIDKDYMKSIWKDFDHMVECASIKVAMVNMEHIIRTLRYAVAVHPNEYDLRNGLLLLSIGHIVSNRVKLEKVSITDQKGETRICQKI